ncbi:hypothetical protein EZS27_042972, partial [termite gut metagenome]
MLLQSLIAYLFAEQRGFKRSPKFISFFTGYEVKNPIIGLRIINQKKRNASVKTKVRNCLPVLFSVFSMWDKEAMITRR